nr:MAG TPA: hypothetical protein [Caudoviricetes sp.]
MLSPLFVVVHLIQGVFVLVRLIASVTKSYTDVLVLSLILILVKAKSPIYIYLPLSVST